MGLFFLFGFLATFTLSAWGQSANSASSSSHPIREFSNPWRSELEKRGYIDYSVSRPYRYALPLTTLGSEDSKLMFTYSQLPGNTGGKGFLLFAKIRIN
jgi:hypothetical protein